MNNLKYFLLGLLCCYWAVAEAHIDPNNVGAPNQSQQNAQASFRADCAQATSQIDQSINNVRARLLNGGDVWWDGGDGKYIVPNVDPASGLPEVSSIFAGAVWLGGFDPAGNLKVAAQTYGSSGGNTDFWPGPLTDFGTVEADTCLRWDRFFKVLGTEIDEHLRNFDEAELNGEQLDVDLIPTNVKGWPARGNEFFFDVYGWELPFTSQGLAAFFDRNGNDIYEPQFGDYPRIEIRGCDIPQYPDEMIFWIYNDNGGIHTQSTNSTAIQMEVQVQSFAYATNDEINDMTFQRYKLINRAIEDIDSCFFAMWVDADLGCHTDDYVGCDTARSLAYIYNEDAADGTTGCTCDGGVNTYCEDVPIIGIDYFRGPLDEFGTELGMSSFTYSNNGGIGDPPAGTTDPNVATEYYNYLSGSWRDGTPFSYLGDGYDPTNIQTINYAFTEEPNNSTGWSMCTADLPFGDRRTIQASGPFKLQPGARNELIIGAVWVPNIEYPCPDITPLLFADDIAQALFNNCFDITDGPDAPDACFLEFDKELICILSNDEISSNNAFENYMELDLRAPPGEPDSMYVFEGYKIYQVANELVSASELDDPERARLIYQVDLKNGVDEIFNWTAVANPNPNLGPGDPAIIWVPEQQVDGADEGIAHTFKITADQFADGDRALINHKKYYFTIIAYAYNNYLQYDPVQNVGQRNGYLEGRRNIGPEPGTSVYTVIPRPITTQNLNAAYGDGPVITRLDGVGVGGNYLKISDETRTKILDESFDGEIVYQPGHGPLNIKIYNPLDVQEGEFQLTFVDEDMANDELDMEIGWTLTNLGDGTEWASESTIDRLNEQLISEFGFSVAIEQTDDAGDKADATNGAIGSDIVYADNSGDAWLTAITDGQAPYNFISADDNTALDPNSALSSMGSGFFFPYTLTDWTQTDLAIFPAWDNTNSQIVRVRNELLELNNVDLVFTSDKDLWSRCVIVETANEFYYDAGTGLGIPTIGDAENFDLRQSPSVGKDTEGGLPKPDGDGVGMGYFPGYAIDVETGKRLNVFFGENSTYNGQLNPESFNDGEFIGADMMFNPTSQTFLDVQPFSIYNFLTGGQHFVYVHRTEYDECEEIRDQLNGSAFQKVGALEDISWTAVPVLPEGLKMLSYSDGLIPTDVTVELRVDNPYEVEEGTNEKNGYPTYNFKLENVAVTELASQEEMDEALEAINVVPNPYYGYSAYETSQFTNTVKITNVPAECTVTIYTLDGKFIRQYKRDEARLEIGGTNAPKALTQVSPAIEWDLENNKGIPVSSGTYIIHVDAPGIGERVIKWFGVARQFDPSGL